MVKLFSRESTHLNLRFLPLINVWLFDFKVDPLDFVGTAHDLNPAKVGSKVVQHRTSLLQESLQSVQQQAMYYHFYYYGIIYRFSWFGRTLPGFVWGCLTWICLMMPYMDLFDGALHGFVWGCLTWICLRVPYIDLSEGALLGFSEGALHGFVWWWLT